MRHYLTRALFFLFSFLHISVDRKLKKQPLLDTTSISEKKSAKCPKKFFMLLTNEQSSILCTTL